MCRTHMGGRWRRRLIHLFVARWFKTEAKKSGLRGYGFSAAGYLTLMPFRQMDTVILIPLIVATFAHEVKLLTHTNGFHVSMAVLATRTLGHRLSKG